MLSVSERNDLVWDTVTRIVVEVDRDQMRDVDAYFLTTLANTLNREARRVLNARARQGELSTEAALDRSAPDPHHEMEIRQALESAQSELCSKDAEFRRDVIVALAASESMTEVAARHGKTANAAHQFRHRLADTLRGKQP